MNEIHNKDVARRLALKERLNSETAILVQYSDIMRFTVLHNRRHKVSKSVPFFMHCKTVTTLLRISLRGHLVMSITKNHESRYFTVLDNPLIPWEEPKSKWKRHDQRENCTVSNKTLVRHFDQYKRNLLGCYENTSDFHFGLTVKTRVK